MENVKEVAPVVAGIAKGVAVAGKAAAKAAAAGGKAAAKGSKVAAKAGSKAAKGTAKAAKGAGKTFKRPNIRSYKDPKTGKVDLDKYRSDQAKYKKIKADQKNRPDMSDVKPDGPTDDRTKRGERKLKAIDKLTDKKQQSIKQGLQTTGDVAKKTANVTGKVVKKTASVAKKATGGAVGAFGTSSFKKESKITFKDYLNKL